MLNGLGATSLHLIDRQAVTFRAVDSTGLITCFEIGATPSRIQFREVPSIGELQPLGDSRGDAVDRGRFENQERWSVLAAGGLTRARTLPAGHRSVRLGELFRVRRGIATGANSYFVMTRSRAKDLGLLRWCTPVITGATEIFHAGGEIRVTDDRRLLLALPPNFDRYSSIAVLRYLIAGESAKGGLPAVSQRFLCQSREPWWSVERPERAPLLVTYMARRPPAFVLNPDSMALLNIGHHLYPRSKYFDLQRLVVMLNQQAPDMAGFGRTYQGGLEKFEPRELAAIEIHVPEELLRGQA